MCILGVPYSLGASSSFGYRRQYSRSDMDLFFPLFEDVDEFGIKSRSGILLQLTVGVGV